MKLIKAHFDGRVFVPDDVINLPANTPVQVLVPDDDQAIEITGDFAKFSEPSFKRIWDNEEDAAYDKL